MHSVQYISVSNLQVSCSVHIADTRPRRITSNQTSLHSARRYVSEGECGFLMYWRTLVWLKLCVLLLVYLAPKKGPAVEVKSKKNSAELKWEVIPLDSRRGFITNYTIFYAFGNTKQWKCMFNTWCVIKCEMKVWLHKLIFVECVWQWWRQWPLMSTRIYWLIWPVKQIMWFASWRRR